ncbi:MAG: Dps family protein, partial [Bryobacteraceae bacterium]
MAKVETLTKELSKEKVNIGLTEQQREGVVETLNRLLADETVLYIKTRNFHWNVAGPRFHQLHEFFEEQYEKLAGIIDDVAENARQFGGHAIGTLSEYLEKSRLKEQPGTYPDDD